MRKTLVTALLAALALSTFGVFAASPAGAQVPNVTCDRDAKTYFEITYSDGRVDSGCAKDKDIDRFTNPGLNARNLHLSCSDDFIGTGTTKKSDLGDPNRSVVSYSIYEVKDGRINKLKCGGSGGGGGTAPGGVGGLPIDPSTCTSDSKTAFLIEYSDTNVVGVDSGCATRNDIDRSTNPGLIANRLHVSCSDDFIGTGTTAKSDLGSPTRSVVAYTIWKIDTKKGTVEVKCGQGTPIPAGGIAGMAVIALVVGGFVLYGNHRRTNRNHAAI
jgi:hypothetical protein